jgi:hypothetical protein
LFHIYSSKTLRNISPVVATSKAACFEVVGSVPCRHATELTAFGGEQMEISPTDPKKWWINVDYMNLMWINVD